MSHHFSLPLIAISGFALVFGLSVPNFAQAALAVTFEAAPLFVHANVLPGDAVTRTVTVTNTGTEPEEIVFSLENTFSDGLATVMEMAVTSGADVYVDTTFSEIFDWGEVDLGTLPGQSSKTYDFTAFLNANVGNPYQLTELGFDLLIGFSGGESVTDTPPRGGGDGSSTGRDRTKFYLFNEAAEVRDTNTGHLTWKTNRNAGSYAVCGNVTQGPFVLDPSDALFGYVFASTEDTAKVLTHSTDFLELPFGKYRCRVASREKTSDTFTVSSELEFEIIPPGQVAGVADSRPLTQGNIFQPSPQVAGVSISGKGAGALTYDEFRAELDALKAAREEAGLRTTSSSTKAQPITKSKPDADGNADTTDNNTPWRWVFGGALLVLLAWLFSRLIGK